MKSRLAAGVGMILFAAAMAAASEGSWIGYISDSVCGVRGAKEGQAECTAKCVKEKGAKYVFVNDADKKVYAIDDQEKVAPHAGHHVTVKGEINGKALKLESIDMAPSK